MNARVEPKEISLLDIIAVVLVRWRIVATVTAAGVLLAWAVALFAPVRASVTSTIEIGLVDGGMVEPMPAVQHVAKMISAAAGVDASYGSVGHMLTVTTSEGSIDEQTALHRRIADMLTERHNEVMIPDAVAYKTRILGMDVPARPTQFMGTQEGVDALNGPQLLIGGGIMGFGAGCMLALLVHIWCPLRQRLRDRMRAAAAMAER